MRLGPSPPETESADYRHYDSAPLNDAQKAGLVQRAGLAIGHSIGRQENRNYSAPKKSGWRKEEGDLIMSLQPLLKRKVYTWADVAYEVSALGVERSSDSCRARYGQLTKMSAES